MMRDESFKEARPLVPKTSDDKMSLEESFGSGSCGCDGCCSGSSGGCACDGGYMPTIISKIHEVHPIKKLKE